MLAVLLAISVAAATPLAGERMRWEVRYLGVKAGHVTSWTERSGGHLNTTGLATSAPWYRPIYDLDDRVVSTWTPTGGTRQYTAQFREGKFHQDQDQRFGDEAVVVDYRQRKRGEWTTWTDTLAPAPGAFDPVAAMQMVRALEGDGPWAVPVFSGRQTWPLDIALVDRVTVENDLLGSVVVRVLDLRTQHRGELRQQGRFRVLVTDDDRRLLVRVVIKTNLGAVRVELVEAQTGMPADGPPSDSSDSSDPSGQTATSAR